MWAWLKKFFEEVQEKETLEHYSVRFYTTDGIMHNFTKYRYAAPERLRCSVPEYIMIDVKSNGYLKDDNEVMYPLQNVVSIHWSKDDEIHDVKLNDKYAIFFDKPIDKQACLCYNKGNKREEPRAMKDKVIMIISICAFTISWGIIILATVLEVI